MRRHSERDYIRPILRLLYDNRGIMYSMRQIKDEIIPYLNFELTRKDLAPYKNQSGAPSYKQIIGNLLSHRKGNLMYYVHLEEDAYGKNRPGFRINDNGIALIEAGGSVHPSGHLNRNVRIPPKQMTFEDMLKELDSDRPARRMPIGPAAPAAYTAPAKSEEPAMPDAESIPDIFTAAEPETPISKTAPLPEIPKRHLTKAPPASYGIAGVTINSQCALCGADGHQHSTEKYYLVCPSEAAKRKFFPNRLDIEQNTIWLCKDCVRKFEYGTEEEAAGMIQTLLAQNKEKLRKGNIYIRTAEDICRLYDEGVVFQGRSEHE